MCTDMRPCTLDMYIDTYIDRRVYRQASPPLSKFPSYSGDGPEGDQHHPDWLYFAVTKSLAQEEITAADVKKHFEDMATVALPLPQLAPKTAAAQRLYGLWAVEKAGFSGHIVYSERLMAAVVYTGGELLTLYSGTWELGDDNTVKHFARAGRISAKAASVNPSATAKGGVYQPRSRAANLVQGHYGIADRLHLHASAETLSFKRDEQDGEFCAPTFPMVPGPAYVPGVPFVDNGGGP